MLLICPPQKPWPLKLQSRKPKFCFLLHPSCVQKEQHTYIYATMVLYLAQINDLVRASSGLFSSMNILKYLQFKEIVGISQHHSHFTSQRREESTKLMETPEYGFMVLDLREKKRRRRPYRLIVVDGLLNHKGSQVVGRGTRYYQQFHALM